MADKRVSLTVAIGAYSEPQLLDRALKSVVKQSYRPLRVLVSDDAGDTSVERVFRRFKLQYPDISWDYHRQPENLGVARNQIWMFSEVRDDYCVFLQHDDEFIDESFLEDAVGLMEANPSAHVCLANSLIEVPGGFPSSIAMNSNYRSSLRVGQGWHRLSGEIVASAMLAPARLWDGWVSLFTRRPIENLNFSWSCVVFRSSAVRATRGLTESSLISASLEDVLDIYSNEEGFVFLYRILAIGDAFITDACAGFRGKPSSSFSDSPSHPVRSRKNNLELFLLLQNAKDVHEDNPMVAALMRRKALSIGLSRLTPEIFLFLKGLSVSYSAVLFATLRGKTLRFNDLCLNRFRKTLKRLFFLVRKRQ